MKSRFPLIFGLIMVAVLIGGLMGTIAPGPIPIQLIAIGGALAAAPFLVGLARGRFDVFEPVYLFAFAYAVLFVLRPMFDLVSGLVSTGWIGYSVVPGYDQALLVGILGTIAFYVGYYLRLGTGFGSRIPVPSHEVDGRRLAVFTCWAVVLSVLLYSLFLATSGGRDTLAALLNGRNPAGGTAVATASAYLSSAPLWISGLAILWLSRIRRWLSVKGLIAFVLLLYSLAAAVTTGARSWTLPLISSLVLVWYLRRARRPALVTVILGIAAILIFGISVPRDYRNSSERQSGLGELVVNSVAHPGDVVRGLLQGADTAMVDDLSIEVQVVPGSLPFQHGTTYLEALTRPIPRALWPDKPQGSEDILMATIWPDLYRQKVGFSFSMFGEPYLNFGLFGVFLLGMIFGVFWKGLYVWYRREPSNLTLVALYAINWPFLFVYMRGGLGVDYPRHLIVQGLVLLAIPIARRALESSSKARFEAPLWGTARN